MSSDAVLLQIAGSLAEISVNQRAIVEAVGDLADKVDRLRDLAGHEGEALAKHHGEVVAALQRGILEFLEAAKEDRHDFRKAVDPILLHAQQIASTPGVPPEVGQAIEALRGGMVALAQKIDERPDVAVGAAGVTVRGKTWQAALKVLYPLIAAVGAVILHDLLAALKHAQGLLGH